MTDITEILHSDKFQRGHEYIYDMFKDPLYEDELWANTQNTIFLSSVGEVYVKLYDRIMQTCCTQMNL